MFLKIVGLRKTKTDRYKIIFDSGNDLEVYDQVIIFFQLTINHEVNDTLLNKVVELNNKWDVFYVALKSLNSRAKSIKEMKNYLVKKEYPLEYIDFAIDELKNKKYLDDRIFTKSYIQNQIITTSRGPYRIVKELHDKGVDSDIIEDEIGAFDKDIQIEKINKIINKSIKSNHTRGGVVLKNKIISDLITLGYEYSIINSIIDTYTFKNDKEMIEREYNKLYKKLSSKYSGKELEYKIKEKLYQKGLYYED